jgi:Dolichyl-phosphate-mannose-protein mannosyltransferase
LGVLFGNSEYALRALSAFFGTLSLPVFYFLAKKVLRDSMAVALAMWLFALVLSYELRDHPNELVLDYLSQVLIRQEEQRFTGIRIVRFPGATALIRTLGVKILWLLEIEHFETPRSLRCSPRRALLSPI